MSVKTVCLRSCFDNKYYKKGQTRTFATKKEAESDPRFKIIEEAKPQKSTKSKSKKITDTENDFIED